MNIVYPIILQWQKDNSKFMAEAKKLKKTNKKKFLLHFWPKLKCK
jgi:hypothetical protein